jgi:hypothetical protein
VRPGLVALAPLVLESFSEMLTAPVEMSTSQMRPRKESAMRRWFEPGRAKAIPFRRAALGRPAARLVPGYYKSLLSERTAT